MRRGSAPMIDGTSFVTDYSAATTTVRAVEAQAP